MIFRALVKTHHMTSRKKIVAITKSAATNQCAVLLKTGSPPGVMLCEGGEAGVRTWVDDVKRLRYKDFQLKVAPRQVEGVALGHVVKVGTVTELGKLKEFGQALEFDASLLTWWKKGMGFTSSD